MKKPEGLLRLNELSEQAADEEDRVGTVRPELIAEIKELVALCLEEKWLGPKASKELRRAYNRCAALNRNN